MPTPAATRLAGRESKHGLSIKAQVLLHDGLAVTQDLSPGRPDFKVQGSSGIHPPQPDAHLQPASYYIAPLQERSRDQLYRGLHRRAWHPEPFLLLLLPPATGTHLETPKQALELLSPSLQKPQRHMRLSLCGLPIQSVLSFPRATDSGNHVLRAGVGVCGGCAR